MKIYLTRSQSKVFASMDGGYVGDPTGGTAYGERNDPATAMIGGSILSGVMGANAAQSAASTQAGAANNAAQAQLQAARESNAMQQKMYDQNVARQQPYVQAGLGSLGALQSGLAPGGQFTKNFGPADLQLDPSYQFRLNQGNQALSASAASRGLLGSGQNLKDVADYSQGAASQEYGNAFNRYQTQQGNLYNRLAGMATMSQNAAAGIGTQGMQVAQNMGNNTMSGAANASNYLTSGAAAQAAGQMGTANAIGSAIGGAGNNWMGLQYMNKYTGRGGTPGGATATPYGQYNSTTEMMGPPASAAPVSGGMQWYE